MTRRTLRPGTPDKGRPELSFTEPARVETGKNRRLDLLAGIAHDMQTPLAVIISSAELLSEDLDLNREARARLLSSIQRQARRLKGMVADLVEQARTHSDSRRPRKEPLEIIHLVQEIASEYRRLRQDHELVVKSGRPLQVEVDREMVRRILQNLLDNAFQYSPPGTTVTLRVLRARGRQEVILAVEDQGPGIPEADEQSAFNPFTRLASSVGAGYGLGLYTVRCLAEAQGGSAWVEHTNTQGACIRVSLPFFDTEEHD